jgi:heterodisulfide reductase subunit C
MPDFGFSINRTNHIDLDNISGRLYEYVRANEPSIQKCIFCGACASTCSAGYYTEMSLRKINLYIMRERVDELRAMLDRCLLCGKCILVCPRDVNTRRVLLLTHKALKNQMS